MHLDSHQKTRLNLLPLSVGEQRNDDRNSAAEEKGFFSLVMLTQSFLSRVIASGVNYIFFS